MDPACTFLFSLVVLVTTLSVLRDATLVLMEGFPRHLDHTAIVSTLHAIDGVRTVHNLHVWSLTLNKYALAVHLSVGELLSKLLWVICRFCHLIRLKKYVCVSGKASE